MSSRTRHENRQISSSSLASASGKQSSQEAFCEACAVLTINFNDMHADGSSVSLAVIPRSKMEVALENSAGN